MIPPPLRSLGGLPKTAIKQHTPSLPMSAREPDPEHTARMASAVMLTRLMERRRGYRAFAEENSELLLGFNEIIEQTQQQHGQAPNVEDDGSQTLSLTSSNEHVVSWLTLLSTWWGDQFRYGFDETLKFITLLEPFAKLGFDSSAERTRIVQLKEASTKIAALLNDVKQRVEEDRQPSDEQDELLGVAMDALKLAMTLTDALDAVRDGLEDRALEAVRTQLAAPMLPMTRGMFDLLTMNI
jgi:hypothetical protein